MSVTEIQATDRAGATAIEAAGGRRTPPGWMKVAAVLCAATVVVSVSRDLFVPASRGVEVWLGLEVTGWAAVLTAPIHWAMFAIAAWTFWTGRTWILPWAASYLFYVAFSHLVWSEASPHGRGWPIGLAQGAVIAGIGYFVLCLRPLEARR